MKKLSKRNIGNIVTASCLITALILYLLHVKRYRENFFKTPINAKVVKSDDWMKRSIKFIFADGNYVYFFEPVEDKIQIGDSVSKPAKSTIFEVYRKNDSGVYYFFRRYDNSETK